jgi:hypothetical protein
VSIQLYLLPLTVIASPLIVAFMIYRVRRTLGRNAQENPTQPATKATRRTYFYPTRELDGNDTGYYGTEL